MGEWNESAVVTVIIVSVLLLVLCCAGNRKNLKCHNFRNPNRLKRNNTKKSGRYSTRESVRTSTFTFTPETSFKTSSCQSESKSMLSRGPLEEEIQEMLSPFQRTSHHMNQTHIGMYQHQKQQQQQPQQKQPQLTWSHSGGRSFHGTPTPLPGADGSWSRCVSLPTKFKPQHKQYPKSPPPPRTVVKFLQDSSQYSDTDEETNFRGASQSQSSSQWSESTDMPIMFPTCVRKPQPQPLPNFISQRQLPPTTSQFGRAKHLSLIKSNKPTRERKNSLDLTAQGSTTFYNQMQSTIFEEPRYPPLPERTASIRRNPTKGILIHRFQSGNEARMREMEMYYQYYDDEDYTPLTSLSPSSPTTTYPDTTESSCEFDRFNYSTIRTPYFSSRDLEMEEHFV